MSELTGRKRQATSVRQKNVSYHGLFKMLHLVSVHNALEDVAPGLQQRYVLIVGDSSRGDLSLEPVHNSQPSQPAHAAGMILWPNPKI